MTTVYLRTRTGFTAQWVCLLSDSGATQPTATTTWFPVAGTEIADAPAPTQSATETVVNEIAAPDGFDPIDPNIGQLFNCLPSDDNDATFASSYDVDTVLPIYTERPDLYIKSRSVINAIGYDYLLEPLVASVNLRSKAKLLVVKYVITGATGSVNITGQAAAVSRIYTMSATTATVTSTLYGALLPFVDSGGLKTFKLTADTTWVTIGEYAVYNKDLIWQDLTRNHFHNIGQGPKLYASNSPMSILEGSPSTFTGTDYELVRFLAKYSTVYLWATDHSTNTAGHDAGNDKYTSIMDRPNRDYTFEFWFQTNEYTTTTLDNPASVLLALVNNDKNGYGAETRLISLVGEDEETGFTVYYDYLGPNEFAHHIKIPTHTEAYANANDGRDYAYIGLESYQGRTRLYVNGVMSLQDAPSLLDGWWDWSFGRFFSTSTEGLAAIFWDDFLHAEYATRKHQSYTPPYNASYIYEAGLLDKYYGQTNLTLSYTLSTQTASVSVVGYNTEPDVIDAGTSSTVNADSIDGGNSTSSFTDSIDGGDSLGP